MAKKTNAAKQAQNRIMPMLDLGLDSSGNTRQITADNSIIQDDDLNGGNF